MEENTAARDETTPELTRVAPWFGAKVKLAAEIVNQISIENARGRVRRPAMAAVPFAGGMSVPLALVRAGVSSVVCGDLHADLVNACRALVSNQGPWIVERLRSLPMSSASFAELKEQYADLIKRGPGDLAGPSPTWADDEHVDGYHACRAFAWLALEWMGNNGQSGTTSPPSFNARFGPGGGDPATRLRRVGDGMAGAVEMLRCMTHVREDFGRTLARVSDDASVAVYCDPPYLIESRSSGAYAHDFESVPASPLFGGDDGDEHDRLAGILGSFDHARVVVSYYPGARLADLYPAAHGWRAVAVPVDKPTANASAEEAGAVELLIVNGTPAPPVTEGAFVLAPGQWIENARGEGAGV